MANTAVVGAAKPLPMTHLPALSTVVNTAVVGAPLAATLETRAAVCAVEPLSITHILTRNTGEYGSGTGVAGTGQN
jgi:hypothetical protein